MAELQGESHYFQLAKDHVRSYSICKTWWQQYHDWAYFAAFGPGQLIEL